MGGGHRDGIDRGRSALGRRNAAVMLAGLLVAAGLVLAAPAQAMTARQAWDGSRAPDTGRPTVSLTFDDGPDPTWTPQVLAALARRHVRAAFFMVGSRAAVSPDLVRRAVAEGHVVESHTWSHARLTTLAAGSYGSEIDRTGALLGSLSGAAVRCVRPPYGAIDDTVAARLTERGLTPMLWNVDPADWTRPGTGAIVSRVVAGLRPGAVVLMHDGGGDRSQTVAALDAIIDAIQQRGYAIAPVCGGGGLPAAQRPGLRTAGTGAIAPPIPADLVSRAPVVAVATTASGAGQWVAAADGAVFAFGDAPFLGSMGGRPLISPVVGMAPTPSGAGYWLVAADGGMFAFGDAPFFGSMGGTRLNLPVVAMAATPTGGGYWLVASDGGIFAFGDAPFEGSTGSLPLNQPVVTIAPTATADGYWLVAQDGGVFAFGSARFAGSLADRGRMSEVMGAAARPGANGYWLLSDDGTVDAFGDAPALGSLPVSPPEWAVAIAAAPGGAGYTVLTARPA